MPSSRDSESDPHTSAAIRYISPPPVITMPLCLYPITAASSLALDTVPAGDWNVGHLVIPRGTCGNAQGKYVLAWTETTQLHEAVGLQGRWPIVVQQHHV